MIDYLGTLTSRSPRRARTHPRTARRRQPSRYRYSRRQTRGKRSAFPQKRAANVRIRAATPGSCDVKSPRFPSTTTTEDVRSHRATMMMMMMSGKTNAPGFRSQRSGNLPLQLINVNVTRATEKNPNARDPTDPPQT